MIPPGIGFLAQSAEAAAPGVPAFAFRTADPDLVRRVLSETGVVREPSGPSLVGYVSAWGEALARWISDFFSARPELAQGIVTAMELVAIGVVAAAAVLLMVLLVRKLTRRRPATPRDSPAWSRIAEPSAAAALDRSAWRSEFEARLARGDVAGALEALWWWLAASLAPGSPVDASWTTRELLTRARRPELLGLSAALDVLMYGRTVPTPGDLRSCHARFEEVLG